MPEDLQYRLYNASLTPPGNAWPNIVAQLDKEAEQTLSLKMQAAALTPPAHIWDNIQNALDEVTQAPVIYMPRRWNRLAVAAVAIGIVVLAGLFYFMSGNSTANKTAAKQPEKPAVNDNSNRSNTKDNPDPRSAATAVTQPGAGNGTTVRYAVASNKNTPVRYAHLDHATLQAWGPDDLNMDNVIEEPLPSTTHTSIPRGEYLTIAAPNGQAVKISARFTDAMDCIFNDEPAQSIDMALRNILWKMRISKWSNKLISSSGFIPSASNFFDIIELEELLKD